MQKRILFVDDEIQILKSIRRLFMDTEYEVFTANSGVEALNILGNEEINLIVSDMRMPDMDGYELLSEVKKRFPDVVRIILSGFAEEKIVFKALQRNIGKLYILKPWENDVLIDTIGKIFQLENVLNNNNILNLINGIEELPTIKMSYQRIINEIENNQELDKIVEVIESDHAIVTKLLHIINSSYYGIKTGSIKRVVSYLGLDNVKNIVTTSSIIDSLSVNFKEKERLEMLWKHSFISNKILSLIYKEFLNKKIPETEMNAGLLSNVGVIFMLHCFYNKYLEIMGEIENNNINVIKIENEIFKTNHQEIGGYLLRWWDIPLPIVEAAIYHHNPFDENIINKQVVCIVHISEKYSWDILGKNYLANFDERVFDVLKIDKLEFEKRLKEMLEEEKTINV